MGEPPSKPLPLNSSSRTDSSRRKSTRRRTRRVAGRRSAPRPSAASSCSVLMFLNFFRVRERDERVFFCECFRSFSFFSSSPSSDRKKKPPPTRRKTHAPPHLLPQRPPGRPEPRCLVPQTVRLVDQELEPLAPLQDSLDVLDHDVPDRVDLPLHRGHLRRRLRVSRDVIGGEGEARAEGAVQSVRGQRGELGRRVGTLVPRVEVGRDALEERKRQRPPGALGGDGAEGEARCPRLREEVEEVPVAGVGEAGSLVRGRRRRRGGRRRRRARCRRGRRGAGDSGDEASCSSSSSSSSSSSCSVSSSGGVPRAGCDLVEALHRDLF